MQTVNILFWSQNERLNYISFIHIFLSDNSLISTSAYAQETSPDTSNDTSENDEQSNEETTNVNRPHRDRFRTTELRIKRRSSRMPRNDAK